MTSTSAPEAPARCSGHRMLDPKTAFVSATRLFVTNLNQQLRKQFDEWDISNRTNIFAASVRSISLWCLAVPTESTDVALTEQYQTPWGMPAPAKTGDQLPRRAGNSRPRALGGVILSDVLHAAPFFGEEESAVKKVFRAAAP